MRVFIILGAAAILFGCSDHPADSGTSPAGAEAETYVFRCEDGFSFTARRENGSLWAFLPGVSLQLAQEPATSGSTYADGANRIRIENEAAALEYAGVTHRNCINDRKAAVWEHAKLNGASFRAVGNEPGWHLEIYTDNEVRLVTDYGQSRYRFEAAELRSQPGAATTIVRAAAHGHRLEATLSAETCQDTMADEQYKTRVVVLLDGRELRGCGRPLF